MITIKNQSAIDKMKRAGNLLGNMFLKIESILVENISTLEIDKWIEVYLNSNDLISSSKGYLGYKHSSCISLNDEVVHGVPSSIKKCKSGDLVKIDVCASFKGYCADMARYFFIDNVKNAEALKLVKTAQKALDAGISMARVGNRLGDISAAIEFEINKEGYGIVREFAGHGIGKRMHEDPEIVNYGKPGCGPLIKAGMAFAIEPMITQGSHKIFIAKDGWTVHTVDGKFAAHVEDTVIVTDNEPLVITRL